MSVACKILERLIIRSLSDYLEENKLLVSNQHGFSRGRSTVTNLLECNSNIFDNFNCGRACDVILFDFCRAFDKIDHNILCHKLKAIGING